MQNALPREIFKAYDIRGVVGRSLTPELARQIGRAFGSEARHRGLPSVAVGRDGRLSGPALAEALCDGLRATGMEVIDVGAVATPMLYFAAHELAASTGIMVTGSHNPPDYNGFKMVMGGAPVAGAGVQALRERIEGGDFVQGAGTIRSESIDEAYLRRICDDVRLARPLRIVVDCGNGIPGAFAPALFRRLGCVVDPLFCEVDGRFPNHHPDPSQPENLQDLVQALAQGRGDIGLAFDGDGDRLGVVTANGRIIFPDRQLMLFAADVLSRNPGAEIIFDVKCTRHLFDWIRSHGGKPTMWKTGHSLIKTRMRETGALLAGEMSGHFFFKERWFGFDDGLYAGARLLECLSRVADISAALESLPDAVSTPELQIPTAEGENVRVVAALRANGGFDGARELIDIDGVRVEYADGFALARPSNTTPVIVLRFEADDEPALARIQADFRRALLAVKPDAQLPF
ncbi:MAG: phosphomannomutase/phosphoglucomutase [Pseudomonadota bacterium]|nr:phosphomannomutase/phosphoglucomutase [Pseudomonadota bacterium]